MEPITQDEARELHDVLEKFYGPLVRHWAVTPLTYEVLGRLITGSGECTQAMHLVPRPWDLSSPLKWASKQVRQAVVRYLKSTEGQHYVLCMKAAARNLRTDFEMAAQGI